MLWVKYDEIMTIKVSPNKTIYLYQYNYINSMQWYFDANVCWNIHQYW